MTYTIIDHGVWERYRPETWPDGAPESAMFARRISDGLDWYLFARNPESWKPDSLKATCLVSPAGTRLAAIVRDEQIIFPPADGRIIEILGFPVDDPAPHKPFEGKLVDLATGEFRQPAPAPVLLVSAAQGKTALFNFGLLPTVQAIVDSHPYEPVRIFFNSATFWEKSNPYLQAIAAELDLSPIKLDALFDAAKKL